MSERRMKILIVDDEAPNRDLIQALLRPEGYDILCASSGAQALAMALRDQPDLILLDIMMPDMDGYHVVGKLKADPATKSIPVIMVTALESRDARLTALNAGAEEFLTKPVDRAELWVRVRNMLRLKEYSDFLGNYNQILETRVAESTRELAESYRDTIFTLVRAAEHKDEETGAHVRRISHYTSVLADILGLGDEFANAMFHASPMHDIGKIGIPDQILFKRGRFNPEEWEVMKTHSALGAAILQEGKSPYIRLGCEIALNHHERWDGTGYPNGLSGEAIPLSARLMSLCDVYDALRSARPYKPAFDHNTSVGIMLQGDGRTRPEHFDPRLFDAFATHCDKFAAIYAEHADDA